MTPLNAQTQNPPPRPRLLRKKHTYFGKLEIPFYNEELDMSQGPAHAEAVPEVGPVFKRVRALASMSSTCDNPISAINPEDGQEKVYFPDFTLLNGDKDAPDNAVMTDVKLAVEIVTTSTKRSEEHDTVFKKKLYAFNGVPEYLIIFPNLGDDRHFEWYEMVAGSYVLKQPDAKGFTQSKAVPGFAVKPLVRNRWQDGKKLRFFYQDLELRSGDAEYRDRRKAEKKAEWANTLTGKERTIKEQALLAAEQERTAKEQALLAVEHERAAKEHERAAKERECAAKEQALLMADQERAAKESALAELAVLRKRLSQQSEQ